MPIAPTKFDKIVGTPATPQFCRVVVKGFTTESNSSTKECFNIFDHYCPTPGPGSTEPNFFAAWWATLSTLWAAAFQQDYTVGDILVQFMDDPANAGTVNAAGPITGAVTTDRAASFVAAVARRKSGLAGRFWRGSIHLGAVPETFTTRDVINATAHAAYDPIINALQAQTAGISDGANLWFPAIFSPTLSNMTASPRIISGSYIQSWSLNEKIGTMKRRKEKG